jgi:hypothetical protein
MWWWASSTNDSDLKDTHATNCKNASPCRHSWDASTQDIGTITIHAKARDNNGLESAEVTQDLRVREVSTTTTTTSTTTATTSTTTSTTSTTKP